MNSLDICGSICLHSYMCADHALAGLPMGCVATVPSAAYIWSALGQVPNAGWMICAGLRQVGKERVK